MTLPVVGDAINKGFRGRMHSVAHNKKGHVVMLPQGPVLIPPGSDRFDAAATLADFRSYVGALDEGAFRALLDEPMTTPPTVATSELVEWLVDIKAVLQSGNSGLLRAWESSIRSNHSRLFLLKQLPRMNGSPNEQRVKLASVSTICRWGPKTKSFVTKLQGALRSCPSVTVLYISMLRKQAPSIVPVDMRPILDVIFRAAWRSFYRDARLAEDLWVMADEFVPPMRALCSAHGCEQEFRNLETGIVGETGGASDGAFETADRFLTACTSVLAAVIRARTPSPNPAAFPSAWVRRVKRALGRFVASTRCQIVPRTDPVHAELEAICPGFSDVEYFPGKDRSAATRGFQKLVGACVRKEIRFEAAMEGASVPLGTDMYFFKVGGALWYGGAADGTIVAGPAAFQGDRNINPQSLVRTFHIDRVVRAVYADGTCLYAATDQGFVSVVVDAKGGARIETEWTVGEVPWTHASSPIGFVAAGSSGSSGFPQPA